MGESLVQRFKRQARSLATHCHCGEYEPVRVTAEPGFRVLWYGLPGTMPVIPERKWCGHRRIERALIKAYRAGRAA